MVNRRQVREFARAAGRLAKTDRLDAGVIAHFAETFAPGIGKPDPLADRLGEHVRYRRSLQDELVALEHQRRRLETPALRERADRRHAALRAEVKEIEREMRAIVDGDPAKKALFACLTALNGVGLVLACTLIANMRAGLAEPPSGGGADRGGAAQPRQRHPARLSRHSHGPSPGAEGPRGKRSGGSFIKGGSAARPVTNSQCWVDGPLTALDVPSWGR